MEPLRTALNTGNSAGEWLGLGASIGVALAAHVVLPLAFFVAALFVWPSREPIAKPEDYMEVSMVVLPRSETKMVHRASRAPVEVGTKAETTPVEAPKNPSDLEFQSDKPEEKQGEQAPEEDENERRRRMLAALMMADAPVGPVDQVASDPDSESDEAINASGQGSPSDPELVKYVSQIEALFKKNFHPLPTITMENPEIVCEVAVSFDLETGAITGYSVKTPSNNPSYDGAAERAVQAVQTVPLPPEKHKDRFKDGYLVRYKGDK